MSSLSRGHSELLRTNSPTKSAEEPKIEGAYEKRGELDETMLHAYVDLKQFAAAAKHARDREMNPMVLKSVTARTEQPLKVFLDKLSIIPFAEHPLTPYFPAVSAEINGKKTFVHLDTGGTRLKHKKASPSVLHNDRRAIQEMGSQG